VETSSSFFPSILFIAWSYCPLRDLEVSFKIIEGTAPDIAVSQSSAAKKFRDVLQYKKVWEHRTSRGRDHFGDKASEAKVFEGR
jgi:hypothetical protein